MRHRVICFLILALGGDVAAPGVVAGPAEPTSWRWEWEPGPGDRADPTVEVCPLRYDKEWAYAVEIDDGPASTLTVCQPLLSRFAYTDAPPGRPGGTDRPFVGSAAVIVQALGASAGASLSWEQLRELVRQGWGVANHSYWHTGNHWDPSQALRPEDFRRELYWSRAMLTALLGPGPGDAHLVYPSGDFHYGPHLGEFGVLSASRVAGRCRSLTADAADFRDLDRNLMDESAWVKAGDPLLGFPIPGPRRGDLVIDFTHEIQPGPDSANHRRWAERLGLIAGRYGKAGADTIWCAPTAEIIRYTLAARAARAEVRRGHVAVELPAAAPGSALTLRITGLGERTRIALPQGGVVHRAGDRAWITTPPLGRAGSPPPSPILTRVYAGPVKAVTLDPPAAIAGVRLLLAGKPTPSHVELVDPRGKVIPLAPAERARAEESWGVWRLLPIVPDRPAVVAGEVRVAADPALKAMEVWAIAGAEPVPDPAPTAIPCEPGPPAPIPVKVTVRPGDRQRFAGLGAGLGNWGRDYQKLDPAERDRLSRLLWRDLRMTTLRLWINLNEYAPRPGQRLTRDFRERYIDSGIVADARRHGVVHLLLAPDNMPESMKARRDGGPNDFALKDESVGEYAALIAEFLAQVRAETGVLIDATGVQNEPNDLDRIAPAQMPGVVNALRRSLDERGLQAVQVIAPESANVDAIYYETVDRLRADPAAWAALAGVASHSYTMGATDEAARRVAGEGGRNARDYWMTEASDNGPESPGDAVRAASLASRFLGDMNHRTTHWLHFIGFEVPDPRDDATRIIAFTPSPLRTTIFQKYHAYRQLTDTFAVGAVFRACGSSLEGDMAWTYGKKPRLTAAAARNPDGTWGIGLSNFTAPTFRADPADNGGQPATTFAVTVSVPELVGAGAVSFAVRRSGDPRSAAGEAVLRDGKVTLTVGPLELVTLRARAARHDAPGP